VISTPSPKPGGEAPAVGEAASSRGAPLRTTTAVGRANEAATGTVAARRPRTRAALGAPALAAEELARIEAVVG
jgi:hypothetical protein